MKIYNVVLLLLPMFIWSQNIKGHIENENQEPISESSIEINENKSIFYSDKDGISVLKVFRNFLSQLLSKNKIIRIMKLLLKTMNF
jgi:hypothetical protein